MKEENEDQNKAKDKVNYTLKLRKEVIESMDKRKKILIISICVFVTIVLLLLLSTIFALINASSTTIIKGVKINENDISKLSKEETKQNLEQVIQEKVARNIKITAPDFEYQINLSQIGVEYNLKEAIDEAYSIGRNTNIFISNYDILKTMIKKENIDLSYTYDEKLLDNILNDMASKVPNLVVEPNYCIEEETLIISKGKTGNSIDKEKVKELIIDKIPLDNKEDNIVIEFIQKEPSEINIEKIYGEVYTEPKDAYYVKDPFEIFPHVNGVNFDLEAAKEMLKEDKEEYEIKLIITVPNVTTDKMGTEAFPDMLSTFSTKYDASNVPRTTNLKLAMAKLDGVVVSPGEVFSYNKTLGKRTAEAGYKEAGGYAGGKVVQTLAGGICQISSTLYDAVVYANLDIVERHNHMFLAGYVGAGKDATVVYGSLDFQFKNTRNYPIMIKTSIGNGIAKIDIYGIREEVEYQVEISTQILSYNTYRVIYEEDSTLPAGTERVTQNGMNGCKSITYKVLKLNGNEVSRTVLSSDSYDPMNKIVKVGPKKTVPTSTKPTTTTKPKENTQNKVNTTQNNNVTTNTNKVNTNTTKNNTTAGGNKVVNNSATNKTSGNNNVVNKNTTTKNTVKKK